MQPAEQVRCGDVGWALARDVGHEVLCACACAAGVREAGLIN
jgi:hypothetical protein